ncbi:unnamed protein product, partial [Timema podura]|nr:unnamed protein product [Timema podura]
MMNGFLWTALGYVQLRSLNHNQRVSQLACSMLGMKSWQHGQTIADTRLKSKQLHQIVGFYSF